MTYRYALVAILIAGSGSCYAADAPTYDIRGPAFEPGFSFHVAWEVTSKGMRVTSRSAGVLFGETTGDMQSKRELEVTIEAADDRWASKIRTRVINDELTLTTRIGEQEHVNLKVNPLVGRVVASERSKTGWTHRLAEGEPTEAEAEALKIRPTPFDENSLPRGKIAVGTEWNVPAEVIASAYADGTDLKATGELKAKFVEVRTHEGEPCAVIRTTGPVRATFMREGKQATLELEFAETRWRSLRRHVGLKAETQCVIKSRKSVKVGTEVLEQTTEGTLHGTSVIKVLK